MKYIDRKEVDQVLIDTYSQPIYEMSLSGGGITTAHLYRTLTLEQIEQMKQKINSPVIVSNNTFNKPMEMLIKIYGGETLSSHQFGKVEKFIEEQLTEKRAFLNNFTQRVEDFYEAHKEQINKNIFIASGSKTPKLPSQGKDPLKEEIVRIFNKKLDVLKTQATLDKFDAFFNGDDLRPFSFFIANNLTY